MIETCIRVVVTGRVQGVFFRDNTLKKANQLGLKGRVKNLADGAVEVIACGDKPQIDELTQWLKKGPPLARVDNCDIESIPQQHYLDFRIDY